MSSYLINKKHHDTIVVDIHDLDGYKFKPRNKGNYVNVSEVTIVNHMMIDKILSLKFDRYFRKLVAMALQVLNDEDSSEDEAQIVLDEAELIKEILNNRYRKYLNHEKEQLFLKKIHVIESEMLAKQIKIKQKANFLAMEEEKTKGRGR